MHVDDLTKDQIEARIEEFGREIRHAKDDHDFAELVYSLAELKHPAVAEYISGLLLRQKNVDRQLITAETLSGFTKPKDAREAAGKGLAAALKRRSIDLDVLETCVHGIGKLTYKPAVLHLGKLLERWRSDPWIPLTILKAFQRLDDQHALPALLRVWEKIEDPDKGKPAKGTSGLGGSGRASGKGKPSPPAAEMVKKAFAKTAQVLTDLESITDPGYLRAWMKAHEKELAKKGIKIPK